MYRLIGLAHVQLLRAGAGLRERPALRDARGQGTVEYVALILLVALVMAGVVAAMKGFRTGEGKELGDVISGKIKEAVKKVEF
jgi:Flp pilus assembly pilin Flp